MDTLQSVDDIPELQSEFDTQLASVASRDDLKNLEIAFLGRKGSINSLFSALKDQENTDLKTAGQEINALKQYITDRIAEKRNELMEARSESIDSSADTSAPGRRYSYIGYLHPTTQTIRKMNAFFRYLGFSVYEGPEIETNEYNFEKLNLPLDHPARNLQDTLYIARPDWLLRTHTSSVEARALTEQKPPIRIVAPGKVYRNETSNTTNNSVFYQYQGLYVDRNVSMADLRGTLAEFVRYMYGKDTQTRIRCKYYPEVEPGVGMDILCTFCGGTKCHVCKYRGWIEVLGAGMVHPNTLRACGLDTTEWSGFAFGMGLDRLVMLKYGIDDVRKLYSGMLVFKDKQW